MEVIGGGDRCVQVSSAGSISYIVDCKVVTWSGTNCHGLHYDVGSGGGAILCCTDQSRSSAREASCRHVPKRLVLLGRLTFERAQYL
jgi:hypothetical protein